MSNSQTAGKQAYFAYLRSGMMLVALLIWVVLLPIVYAQSMQESGVDAAIKPGDDFFGYANGGWLKATEIPAGKNRWGARNEIDVKTEQQLATLIAEAASSATSVYARKVVDFRAAYLDTAAIEAKGLNGIKSALERIATVQDRTALARLLGSELRADVDPLNWGIYSSARPFGIAVQRGIHGEKNNFAYLLQGGLGLTDRDRYLDASTDAQALRVKYQAYVARLLQLSGFDHASARAQAVLELEAAIAKTHATEAESSQEKNADTQWARADFAKKAPGMDWSAFFTAAGLSKLERLVVWQPSTITGEAALIESQSLDTWKDYLRFHLVDRYADVLPHAIADAALAFHGAEKSSREQRAFDATNVALSDAVGHMYVDKYFPAAVKAKVKTIVADVITAFGKRIDTVQWMTAASKVQAHAKLKSLYFGVGYPEKWMDYASLSIDAHDAAGNLRRVEKWSYNRALQQLNENAEVTEWALPPQKVAAILTFIQNSYNFSAALLQSPKFDPTASVAEMYGSFGAIAGHEVSHFVDTLGADYDATGAAHKWWTAADLEHFQAASQPLVDQFSSYRPFPDLHINGKLTLSENIADLGGLSAAFDAYRLSLGTKAADKQYVRQQDRKFFIAFARAWRTKLTEDALRTQVSSNDHAPESYRVDTVRNIDAWYEAFDVLPGQKLYLSPKERVRIW